MNHNSLTGKISAVNAAHAEALRLFPILVAIFAPLVGLKILKVDGTLLEKYRRLVPELPNTPKLSIYRNSSNYNLAWIVKSTGVVSGDPNGGHTVCYYEYSLWIGALKGDTLESVETDPPSIRVDYTAEEINEKRSLYRAAQSKASEALSALYPFEA